MRMKTGRLRDVRPKDAAFGIAGIILAAMWLVAAIRVWPAIAPAARPTPTARPTGDVDVPRLAGRIAIAAEGDLFVLRDGKLSPVATGGGRHDPALSPDGGRIAYTRDGSIDGKRLLDGQVVPAHLAYSDLVSRSVSGSGEDVLVNGLRKRDAGGFHVVEFESQPAWSADGNTLAFISDGGAGAELQTYAVAAKRITTLSEGSILADPAWSPDGKTIAVTSYTQGRPIIRLVPADGRAPATTLTIQPDGDLYRPSYSPDGRWLLVTLRSKGGNDLLAVEVATHRVLDVTNDAKSWGGVFSPDGSEVAFLREHEGEIDLFMLEVGDLLRAGSQQGQAAQIT